MPTMYRLVIKGDLSTAEDALRKHRFSSWRVVHGTPQETFVHVAENVDYAPGSLVTVLNLWLTEDGSKPAGAGSLLFWKVFDPTRGPYSVGGSDSRVEPKRGPKIIDDLDGVEDNVKRAPLWATIRSRRT